MAKHGALLFSYAFSILVFATSLSCKAIDSEDRKTYIVYLGSLPHDEVFSPLSNQIGILERVVQKTSAANFLLTSYKRSFNGFAAKLTEQERERLAGMKEVVSVFPSRTFQLQTTRSWDFLGLNQTAKRNATVESNTIIGVIDSGISPDSESFNDEGFGPAPKKWKGVCKGGQNFTCNNKIIGARYYTDDGASDAIGHGTHTASTAAGNPVKDVSFYGLAQGTARGGVPSARIAAYKVCSVSGCPTEAILQGFDDAIADGVDIITISIGAESSAPFQQDPIAIGAFHAMEKGILTLQSAGNSGPEAGSVSSVAPWTLTVAASSTDRRIIDKIVLGNGKTIVGSSVNSFKLNGTSFPLVYGKDASSQCVDSDARQCVAGCLDVDLVKGKIVLCDQAGGNTEARQAGALGSILNTSKPDVAFVVPLPASGLGSQDYDVVKSYLKSTKRPRANILKSEAIKDDGAPVVASFSSRGPNQIVPEIIKPDISAPGIDILAAYSTLAPITGSTQDKRRVKYSILSGTSMSCPHVAGVAAYIKTFHPDWSPAAIKSSIMTTAWPVNDTKTSPAEFAYGSGHINPLKAINPGLVFEASKEDYIKFLCSVLDEGSVRLISGDSSSCPAGSAKVSPKDLNYPSLAANVNSSTSFTINFHRTVKNVGLPNSTYKANILSSSKVAIKVVPHVLSFKSLNEEKTFDVTVVGRGIPEGSHVSASLVWTDGTHSVRTPILVAA
ncbi:PREDICTED: subtilisin [Prunus dulcis]|uniref:PREDICTED: subtilisin n=1 Tax=Prunus dulcis TaxID=3755 RepID=A0A5E4GMV3_PRUDU|nr:subtilisin-like protease SBT4.5 [Prunus dulcis]VVA40888.1 PREDICTED: subtilisin [Prunus dulcis]